MRIAVAGGTGVTGRHVVRELSAAGHQPVVLARATGVDLTTGAGLADKLEGADALIDVTNVEATAAKPSIAFFDAVGHTLLEAERRADVRHHVALSIVGIDVVDYGYYHGKLRQEALARDSGLPATIVRATQFHEFSGQVLERASFGPLAVALRMRCQPIAVREVARYLVAAALERPGAKAAELAGPQEEDMAQLQRKLVKARGAKTLLIPLTVPGAGGKAMRDGGLLPTGPGPRGTQTWDQWLASADGRAWL